MRSALAMSAALPLLAALALAAPSSGARATPAARALQPTVSQDFSAWGTNRFSRDGLWQKNGDWTTTWSQNTILQSLAVVQDGRLQLSVPAGERESGEIQSAPLAPVTFSYGYYQTRMQTPTTPGVCTSFFWIAKDYGLPEVDVEFLTNEPWLTSASAGRVHLSVHKKNGTVRDYRVVDLPFNPSRGMHTYGFVIAPTFVSFDIDGRTVWRDPLPTNWSAGVPKGFIMANVWTGMKDWGGGPPTRKATASYDWMRFYSGAQTAVPG